MLDHPSRLAREDRVKQVLTFMETDTVSFRSHEGDTEYLYETVCASWDPICDWFEEVSDPAPLYNQHGLEDCIDGPIRHWFSSRKRSMLRRRAAKQAESLVMR